MLFLIYLEKHLVSKIDPVITVLVPLSITGILSIIILLTNGYKNKIENIENKELCLLLLGGFMIPTSLFYIHKNNTKIHNPGYAKTIVSLNILISSILSLYFFKDAKLNEYTGCGILLVLGGTYLITKKA